MTQVAALPAAVDDKFPFRRPGRQHFTQERVPLVLIQLQCTRDMTTGELFVRSGVKPENLVAPAFRFPQTNERRIGRRLLVPDSRVAVKESLPDCREKGQPQEQEK